MATIIEEIHVGDIGTVFIVTLKDGAAAVNISTATEKKILFKKPDETILSKDGVFVTDGSDGKMKYTTISGDISSGSEGTWELQARVVMPTGTWSSSVQKFQVYENIQNPT